MQFNNIDLALTIKMMFAMVSEDGSEEMHLDGKIMVTKICNL